jgi:hypothetical protein
VSETLRTAFVWLIAALGVYGAIVGLAAVFQRSLQYFPFGTPGQPAALGVPEMREIRVRTADGLDLFGWHAPPRAAGAPTVVVFHGNAGNLGMLWFIGRRLIDEGVGVLLAGYRGFEGNPGRPSEQGLYLDGRAALDWLNARGVADGDVVLYGLSLGSGVASQIATERRVAAVIFEAPFTAMADVGAFHYPFLPVRWMLLDRFETRARVAGVEAPLLVVHGDRDEVIPFAQGAAVFAAAREPKRFVRIAGGRHNDLWERGAGEAIARFAAARGR